MRPEAISIAGPDGRRLDVRAWNLDLGAIVITHGGTPDAGSIYEPLVEVAAERGLGQLSYARPGYRDSDRRQGRTVTDCAADVAAIADELGIERFHTLGWSGGGPHALACAALLPERVLSAASVAGVAPRDADGLDWLDGMGEENVEEFGAVDAGPDALRDFLAEAAAALGAVTGSQVHEELGDLLSPVDRSALTGEFAEHMADSFKEAVGTGIDGWLDDDLAFANDWGFDLEAIEVPVSIWQGGEDRFVPPSHGGWLASHVGGARAHLPAGQGHLSLMIGCYGEILDDLVAAGDR